MLEKSLSGPFRVARRFLASHLALALLSAAGGVTAVAYYGGSCLHQAAAIQREQRIWRDGEPARRARFEVSTESWWFVLDRHQVEVTYELASGEERTGSLELETLFGALTTDATVRVSRDDPTAFALKPAVDAASSRWAAIAFTAMAGGAVGVILLAVAASFLARVRRVRRAAATGAVTRCRLTARWREQEQSKASANEVFRFEVPQAEGAPPREVAYRCRTASRPALTTDEGRLVVAVVPADAPEQSIVLQEGFYPLALSPAQADAVEALLRAPSPPPAVTAEPEADVDEGERPVMPTELIRGPFRVLPGYVGRRVVLAVLMLVGAVMAAIAPGAGRSSDLEGLLTEGRVWRDGEPAVSAHVSGTEVVGSLYPHAFLEVTYETVAGERFVKQLEVRSLYGAIDLDQAPEVRVSRDDPSVFALNLAVEASSPRWAFSLLALLLRLVLGGLALYQAVDWVRELYRVRRAAATGVAVFCSLLRRDPLLLGGKPMGWDRLRFEVPASVGGPLEVECRFQTKDRAAITLGEDRLVLAVVPPESPGHALVVSNTFHPLGLSEAQLSQVRAAFEAAARAFEEEEMA